jgi:hypothetical protein
MSESQTAGSSNQKKPQAIRLGLDGHGHYLFLGDF